MSGPATSSRPSPTRQIWRTSIPTRDLGLPRRVPLHARHPADDVPRPAVDDAAVRRVRHGGGVEPRYRYLLSQGVNGLSVAFDLPTQIGYDSDHPLAAGEVGRVGVAIDSIEDMAALFDGIPLDRVSTSMTINATAIILLALYVAVGEAPGRRRSRSCPAPSRTTCSRSTSRAAPTSIRPRRRCGSSPTSSRSASARCRSGTRFRSAAITSARPDRRRSRRWRSRSPTRSPTSRPPIDAGLDVNAFGQRLSFFFNAHNDFLEEVAKFRAARRLWARLMRDRFGATNPRAAAAALSHADGRQHAHRAAARQQHRPRRAAGAGGGARRHAVAPHQRPRRGAGAADRGVGAHRAPDAADHRARDPGVTNTVDPFAGSYYIEKLTNEIEDRRARSARAHRRARRHAGRDRERVYPAADSGLGLPRATGDRYRRRGRGRRQPLCDRRTGSDRDVLARPDARARADRARQGAAGASRRGARGRPRWPASKPPREGPTTSCPRSSPPSKPTQPSERSQIRCAGRSSASRVTSEVVQLRSRSGVA